MFTSGEPGGVFVDMPVDSEMYPGDNAFDEDGFKFVFSGSSDMVSARMVAGNLNGCPACGGRSEVREQLFSLKIQSFHGW